MVGELEPPGFAVVRARERAFLVAEDFRFEERIGQRRAVDGLELFRTTPAQLVNHVRDELLAGAGRSEDQHGNIGLGCRANPLEHDQHLFIAADHLPEALYRGRLVLCADCRAPLEKRIEQLGRGLAFGPHRRVARRRTRQTTGDAELDELVEAVVDVELQPPEGGHQRLAVERLVRTRAQIAQNPRAQRRLHEVFEARFDVGRIIRTSKRCAGTTGGVSQFIHR